MRLGSARSRLEFARLGLELENRSCGIPTLGKDKVGIRKVKVGIRKVRVGIGKSGLRNSNLRLRLEFAR